MLVRGDCTSPGPVPVAQKEHARVQLLLKHADLDDAYYSGLQPSYLSTSVLSLVIIAANKNFRLDAE
jgi:hypothetical protein